MNRELKQELTRQLLEGRLMVYEDMNTFELTWRMVLYEDRLHM